MILTGRLWTHTRTHRELNIVPPHSQLQFSKSLLMHSIIYKNSPKSFNGIWTTNREKTQIYELQNNDQLTLPHPRIELFKRSPLYVYSASTMEPTGCNKTTTQQNYFQNCTNRKTFVWIDPCTYAGLVSTSYYPNSLILSPTCQY